MSLILHQQPPYASAFLKPKVFIKNIWLSSKLYSKEQIEFHHHIDNIIKILNKPLCYVPQIQYGLFQDVSKGIKQIGTFFNPYKKHYIFKAYVNKQDLLNKLLNLHTLFDRCIVLKFSDNNFNVYDYDLLKEYIIAAINVVNKHN